MFVCIVFAPHTHTPHTIFFSSCLCVPISIPPPTTTTFYTFSLPPSLHSGSAGVHMIKHGTQVITWHCQIKRPLIQMRSEISKTSVAFAATTHPRRRQRGDLSVRGPAGRQQQHSAFPSYKISPMEATEPNMLGFTRAYLFVSHTPLVH